ncbi:hypothetical protein [Rhodoligotrophos defluvii]|uniref:hypothetical protein n=1 Tax=Rhodoligotrophos defluvii TaxID=2561934 RepID=UPI0010C9754E|nr:hypothetical protein [Rhodoligotrophos defluvii]
MVNPLFSILMAAGVVVGTVVTAGPLHAVSAPALPKPVAQVISGYTKQCSGLGGKLKNPNAVRILAGDLDGDRKLDYLINTDQLTCDGAFTAFCANAGCQIDILLSSKGYRHPVSLQGGVPRLIQQPEQTVAEIEVDRTQCNDAPRTNACIATYSWTKGKEHTTYEQRPRTN